MVPAITSNHLGKKTAGLFLFCHNFVKKTNSFSHKQVQFWSSSFGCWRGGRQCYFSPGTVCLVEGENQSLRSFCEQGQLWVLPWAGWHLAVWAAPEWNAHCVDFISLPAELSWAAFWNFSSHLCPEQWHLHQILPWALLAQELLAGSSALCHTRSAHRFWRLHLKCVCPFSIYQSQVGVQVHPGVFPKGKMFGSVALWLLVQLSQPPCPQRFFPAFLPASFPDPSKQGWTFCHVPLEVSKLSALSCTEFVLLALKMGN